MSQPPRSAAPPGHRASRWFPVAAVGAILLPLLLSACGDTGYSEGFLEATARRSRNQLVNEVRLRALQFAPTEMRVDLTGASERERKLLEALLRAAGLADEIFWRQTGHLALPYRAQVRASYPRDHIVREFYMLQMGPYDRLDDHRAYMDVPPKSPGAGFYPPDMTAGEFRAWLEDHPEDREAFTDPYTVIRRRGDSLEAVPYHDEYRELVEPLAAALREAASHAVHPRLQRVLELKAEAVLTDDYYDADTAWVRMDDAPFDVVIGPFEVYEDRLLNLKAGYQASVELVDSAASAELDRFREHLGAIEAALPYPDSLKPDSVDLTTTFTVVRDIYRGGLIGTGYQPVAANLPNDPRVHTTVGTKKTFWKNVMDARFDSIIAPIGEEALAEDQREELSAEAFFHFVVFHELAHGLGPRYAATGGERVPVNRALANLHSWLEENKADVVGLLAMDRLMEEGVLDPESRREHLVSYLASLLRTVRFGAGQAHGLAALVSLNWYLEHGGVTFDEEDGRYRVAPDALTSSVRDLAAEILAIQAYGDTARARRLRSAYGGEPASLEEVRDRLGDLPVDVVPVYRIRW